MTCDGKTCLKSVQFGFCVVVLVYKIWTIWEEHRVTLLLQKKSLEWSWSSYTSAGDPVSLLSDITFGSYVIISGAFLLGRILGDLTTKAESILLVVGFLLYFITGGILINAVDDVPHKLVANTLILGILSIVTGALFLFDAGVKGRSKKKLKDDPKLAKLEKERKKEMIVVLPSTSDESRKTQSKAEPQREFKQSEYADVRKPSDSSAKEKSKDAGVHSVEIRIKEPEVDTRDKERTRAVRGLDVVEGVGYSRDPDDYPKYQPYRSKRDDDYLRQTPKLVLPELEAEPVAYLSRERNGPKYFPSVKTSPVRHTSSYYVSNPHSPFAWKRLEEHS